MGLQSIWLTLVVLVFMDSCLANPLLEDGIFARTFFQQNMKCGTRSAYKRITMSSPNTGNPQNCEYNIRAYSTKVCQVRIDFLRLSIEQPRNADPGTCDKEYVRIQGMEFDLCGILQNQHVYVPFDVVRITEDLKINIQVSSTSMAFWSMEVNQIECTQKAALVTPDERQAPDGCLQYFYRPTGQVQSFNYDKQLIGDTKYAICFNRNNNEFARLQLSDIKFEMGALAAPPASQFDDGCLISAPTNSEDYIAIPFAEVVGDRPYSLFCGDGLDGESLIYQGTGPIVIHVNTDRKVTPTGEKGFSFSYRVM